MRTLLLRQCLNIFAAKFAFVVLRKPKLIFPLISIGDIRMLPECIESYNTSVLHNTNIHSSMKESYLIKYVLFDKDNTLTIPFENKHYGLNLNQHAEYNTVLASCKALVGDNIAILSNSIGSSDDKITVNNITQLYSLADEVERKLLIPVIRHGKKKPDCMKEVLHYIHTIQNKPDIRATNICVVGM